LKVLPETETGISAFNKRIYGMAIFERTYIFYNQREFKIDYTFEEIEQVNWNEEWERI
jgi:ribosomal protein L11 methyltransferase